MRGNYGWILVVAFVSGVGLWGAVASPPKPLPLPNLVLQQGGQNDGPPFFLVGYDTQANYPPATQQLYQQFVNTLNGYTGVPNNRLNYYSAVNNANGCVITGWQAIIANAQPNCNGYLVTLNIIPTLASDTYGQAGVIFDSDYSEQYQVNNDGTFLYEGSFDPQGRAGQMPGIATL